VARGGLCMCCIRVMVMWWLLFILASLGSQLFFTDSDVVLFFKFGCKMGLYICGSISLTWRFLVEVLEVSFIGRGIYHYTPYTRLQCAFSMSPRRREGRSIPARR